MTLESLINEEERGFLESFRGIVPDELQSVAYGEELLTEAGFPSLLGEVFSSFGAGGGRLGAFLLFVIGTIALMAATSLISGRFSKISECAVMLISGTALFSEIFPIVGEIVETLGGVLTFFTSFIPIMTSIVAYGGGSGAAAIGAAGANMTLGIIGGFVIPLMNSCTLLLFALGLVSAVGSASAAGLAARVKSFFMWLVGLSSVLLLSSLALQSAIASSADTALMRAAKYAASGLVPIVGGAVSSAMGALGSGASYIKSAVGTGTLTVILLMTLAPLAQLLTYRAVIAVGEGVLDFLGVPFGARIFSSLRSALDALAAVFALSVCVLLLDVVILMKSGVRAF